MQNVMIAFG